MPGRPEGRAGLVVLGLDPGSRATGFGLVRERSGQAGLVAAGVIRLPAGRDIYERLGIIYEKVARLIKEHAPDEAAVENVFVSANTASALKLGQARGAAIAACAVAGLPVAGYEPSKVKQAVAGAGRAGKDQVAFMVARVLGVKGATWPADASDALAVAVCHLNLRRFRKLAGLV
jgi:crossover junction endodeoxyribonuclease RuvC